MWRFTYFLLTLFKTERIICYSYTARRRPKNTWRRYFKKEMGTAEFKYSWGGWRWQNKTELDGDKWSVAYLPLTVTRHKSSHSYFCYQHLASSVTVWLLNCLVFDSILVSISMLLASKSLVLVLRFWCSYRVLSKHHLANETVQKRHCTILHFNTQTHMHCYKSHVPGKLI